MLMIHHSALSRLQHPFQATNLQFHFYFVQLQLLMQTCQNFPVSPLLNKNSLCPLLVALINADHPESRCASTSSNNKVSDQLPDIWYLQFRYQKTIQNPYCGCLLIYIIKGVVQTKIYYRQVPVGTIIKVGRQEVPSFPYLCLQL